MTNTTVVSAPARRGRLEQDGDLKFRMGCLALETAELYQLATEGATQAVAKCEEWWKRIGDLLDDVERCLNEGCPPKSVQRGLHDRRDTLCTMQAPSKIGWEYALSRMSRAEWISRPKCVRAMLLGIENLTRLDPLIPDGFSITRIARRRGRPRVDPAEANRRWTIREEWERRRDVKVTKAQFVSDWNERDFAGAIKDVDELNAILAWCRNQPQE